MPIIAARATASIRGFGFALITALKTVIDTFNRANTTSGLGSISGQAWKIWRGGWRINSNKADMTTTASQYPMATLTFTEEDVTVGVDAPAPGMGMSFWVSDEGNWWGAVYRQTYQCDTCFGCAAYTCNAYNCAYGCSTYSCSTYAYNCGSSNAFYTAPNYTCYAGKSNISSYNKSCNITGGQNLKYSCSITSYTVNKAARYTCNSFYTAPNYTCTFGINYNVPPYACNITGGQNLKYNCNSPQSFCASVICNVYTTIGCVCNSTSCTSFFPFDCNCSTTHKIDVVQSVSNTISQIATSNFNAAIASFKSILSGSNITIKAFSGAGYNSQIGSDWTATTNVNTATKKKRHGILGSQSNHAQGTTIDEFRVEE